MKTIAFLDCHSGISGDMMLGALVDAGLPLTVLRRELRKLPLRGYSIRSATVSRGGVAATHVDISLGKTGQLRRWGDVRKIIEQGNLPPVVRRNSLRIFRNLFDAEARVHGGTRRTVHLHELGAVDCIVDIVGTAIGLHALGVESVHASPVNVGSGMIQTEHGELPVPAPATVELLRDVPVHSDGPAFEMTTPTGAAIIGTLAGSFGTMPEMELQTVGVGAGRREPDGWPNVLRVFIGRAAPAVDLDEEIVVVETNIDDMDPRAFEPLSERLFRMGALDVFLEPIIMKKFRPAVRLSVLCNTDSLEAMTSAVLEESTTLGVRVYGARRRILERRNVRVDTSFGPVRVKLAFLRGRLLRAMPEYEDVKRTAEDAGVSFRRAMNAARKAALAYTRATR